jgi:hypothetical protein
VSSIYKELLQLNSRNEDFKIYERLTKEDVSGKYSCAKMLSIIHQENANLNRNEMLPAL